MRSLSDAVQEARRIRRGGGGSSTIVLHEGTYTLTQPLVLTSEDSGTAQAPLLFTAADGESVVISGGSRLELEWESGGDGTFRAKVPPDLVTDQLFVNGEAQPMARYPNLDPKAEYFGGAAADAFSPDRAKRWSRPEGGWIHAMHKHLWGDFHYLITGKREDGAVRFEGGWQNNRQMGMHDTIRFVENIREELDAPGEWYLDRAEHRIYYKPTPGLDLKRATFEAVRLRDLVELRGDSARPVRFVTFRGITFRHAGRTFMDNREPLLRSDWTVYRGAAVLFEGTEDCTIEDCDIDRVGGNAVFVNKYNRRAKIRGCHIVGAGANGVSFVGDPAAVRSPLFEYGDRQELAKIDRVPGPKTADYPRDCLLEDSLIHATGRIEKQSAPVQIAIAESITVRHCSIYDVPRAGINIGDGCWGGHVIEFCDVFDTVKETGDHGSFNSWGRDRYWGLRGIDLNQLKSDQERALPLLDCALPIVLRNNRWRCDHGWDIDLDDGSTHYELRQNLCLNGGIKLREGFYRLVEGNVMVNNSFHPHVWYQNSGDRFRHNIVCTTYKPIGMTQPWGAECDANLLHVPAKLQPEPATSLHTQSGRDERSLAADARFINPARGDYRVKDGSPALELGFKNFAMNQFGVTTPRLRALARTPELPVAK